MSITQADGNRLLVYVVVALVAAAALVGAYFVYGYLNPPKPCCAPEPVKGQLYMYSYNFQVNGTTGSIFAVFGLAEGQGVSITEVRYDQTPVQPPQVSSSCGLVTTGSFSGYECTMTLTFGGSLPAPPSGSVHSLAITTSVGVESSFHVTAGYLYESTTTA